MGRGESDDSVNVISMYDLQADQRPFTPSNTLVLSQPRHALQLLQQRINQTNRDEIKSTQSLVPLEVQIQKLVEARQELQSKVLSDTVRQQQTIQSQQHQIQHLKTQLQAKKTDVAAVKKHGADLAAQLQSSNLAALVANGKQI